MSTATDTTLQAAEWRKRRGSVIFLSRLVTEKPLGLFGMILVLVMFGAGIFADWVAPYALNDLHLLDRLLAPGGQYLLGTDNLGRDLLSQTIYGARVSLIIGLGATALSTVVGAAIGLTSGYIGGKFDLIVQRFVDAWITFPLLVLYLMLMAIMGGGYLQLIGVLGIGGGIGGSRWSRALTFWVKGSAYFDAARAIGCGTLARNPAPPAAQCDADADCELLDVCWRDYPCRGGAELPRIWPPSRGIQLGRDDQRNQPHLHGDRPLVSDLARPGADSDGVRSQHVRRCTKGPARPQT